MGRHISQSAMWKKRVSWPISRCLSAPLLLDVFAVDCIMIYFIVFDRDLFRARATAKPSLSQACAHLFKLATR